MKFFYFFIITSWYFAQVPAYYNEIDFNTSSDNLKSQLATLITETHTGMPVYYDTWEIIKQTDVDPNNASQVYLFYGYDNNDGHLDSDVTRNINSNGTNIGQWNREHVFPKSLGNPNLGTVGPGADTHMLRASDVQKNGQRGNYPFSYGSGVASYVVNNNGFYPGEQWKGDVARIIMYMYLRYGPQCEPNVVAYASSNSYHQDMPDIFLTWNSEDPVSDLETQRNNVLENELGNRNPFIDNPYLATLIWGGPAATNTWNLSSEDIENQSSTLSISPNPTRGPVLISENIEMANICTLEGRKVKTIYQQNFDISDLPPSVYLIEITTLEGENITLKLIKN